MFYLYSFLLSFALMLGHNFVYAAAGGGGSAEREDHKPCSGSFLVRHGMKPGMMADQSTSHNTTPLRRTVEDYLNYCEEKGIEPVLIGGCGHDCWAPCSSELPAHRLLPDTCQGHPETVYTVDLYSLSADAMHEITHFLDKDLERYKGRFKVFIPENMPLFLLGVPFSEFMSRVSEALLMPGGSLVLAEHNKLPQIDFADGTMFEASESYFKPETYSTDSYFGAMLAWYIEKHPGKFSLTDKGFKSESDSCLLEEVLNDFAKVNGFEKCEFLHHPSEAIELIEKLREFGTTIVVNGIRTPINAGDDISLEVPAFPTVGRTVKYNSKTTITGDEETDRIINSIDYKDRLKNILTRMRPATYRFVK